MDVRFPARQCLLSPLELGRVVLPNRIAMSPMTRGFCPDGEPTQAVADYYARRASGGCGLIITEATGINHPSAVGDAGLGEDHIPVLHGDAPIAGWRRVIDAVHAAGGLIVPQLWHQGVLRIPGTGPHKEAPAIGPSGLWGPFDRMTSLGPEKRPLQSRIGPPMTEAEIESALPPFRCDGAPRTHGSSRL